ncbi:hypothetical protein [Pandoravirus japonicus]|uniref:Transmembrane protein n=1 Tax=Pandoravirus japonicus TaxID=2823154 RepID=A0A811BRZ6_9VIRU|nr:hypothetical protein [Pandoravirus japonicus]
MSLLCGAGGDTGSRPSFFCVLFVCAHVRRNIPVSAFWLVLLCFCRERGFGQKKRVFVWPIEVAGTRARYMTGAVRAVFGTPRGRIASNALRARALFLFPVRPNAPTFFPIVALFFFFSSCHPFCLPMVFLCPRRAFFFLSTLLVARLFGRRALFFSVPSLSHPPLACAVGLCFSILKKRGKKRHRKPCIGKK